MEETQLTLPSVFKISSATKIFYGITAFALCVASIFTASNIAISRNAYMVLLPIAFTSGAILIVVNILRRKVVIDGTGIFYTGIFSSKSLFTNEIKGYRADTKTLAIISNGTAPNLKIGNYIDFEKSKEILNWSKANFQDLNALDLELGMQDFLNDETQGFSEDERKAKLKTAKELALAYNIWGGVAGFILLFFKQKFAYITLLIFPLIGIALLFSFNLIKFLSNKDRCIYPQIVIGFTVPCAMLLIKTTDFSLLSNDKVWLPVTIFFVLVFPLVYFKAINKSMSYILGQCALMGIIVIVYGLGCFRTLNCVFDESEQSLFKATVLGKHVSHGKSTTYYLKLNKWGPQKKINNEQVSLKMFNKKSVGDFVTVSLKPGYLDAPWYSILRDW